jgi:hypothetical protein
MDIHGFTPRRFNIIPNIEFTVMQSLFISSWSKQET